MMGLIKELLLEESTSITLDTTFEQVKQKFGSTSKLQPTLSDRNVKFHLDILTKGYFDKFDEAESPFAYCGARLHTLWWEQFDGDRGDAKDVLPRIGFDSIESLIEAVQGVAETLQGNGWIVVTKDAIVSCPNHSWSMFDDIILLIDLWEHSYQQDYQADKRTYVERVIRDAVSWNIIGGRL